MGLSAPTTCPDDPVLSTDGTVNGGDFIAVGATAYYTLNLKSGHSYAVEVWDPFDATAVPVVSPQIQLLNADCTGGPAVTDVTSWDPDISGGFAARVSWIQGSNSVNHISVANPDMNNGYTYYIRVTDTTLRSPRWSTVVGFSTHYGFLNNTDFLIKDAVLNVTTVPPLQIQIQTYTVKITIAPDTELFEAIPSNALNVPPNLYGFATLAFVGPPGAITADGYFQTVTNGIFSIAPTTFGPANRQY